MKSGYTMAMTAAWMKKDHTQVAIVHTQPKPAPTSQHVVSICMTLMTDDRASPSVEGLPSVDTSIRNITYRRSLSIHPMASTYEKMQASQRKYT